MTNFKVNYQKKLAFEKMHTAMAKCAVSFSAMMQYYFY